ncbi:armadillo-type protein [Melampsora americana]|nr:armadillo-type protein [Melampsora americana]
MVKFKASPISKRKYRSQQKPTRSKPGIALPRQIAAELTALGHSVEGSSSRGKTHTNRRGRPQKPNHPEKRIAQTKTGKPQSKPVFTKPGSTTKPSPLAPSNTALGRLLARQDAAPVIKSKKRKLGSSEEDLEDARIAWLERELGVRDKAQGKLKLRKEFEEDGLEDLFDGLEELDKLADRLREPAPGSVDGEHQSHVEQDCSDDESEWSGCHIDMEIEDELLHDAAQAPTYDAQVKLDEVKAEDNTDSPPNPSQSGSTAKRYVPPHLRQKDTPGPNTKDGPTLDPRLRRQIMGILNRVSPTTVPACLESLRALYTTHARAVVTEGLVQVILELVGTRDELGAALVVTYSATIAAISRGGVQVSGVEIGWAPTLVASLICRLCEIYENRTPLDHGKAGPNLLRFLSHIYFFQVIGCPLVYDFVRLLINEGLNETRVEGLMILLKNAGPRLRYDDPVALKEIVQMAQAHKREGGEANSRTNFMFETLQDLKNNKIRKEALASTSTVDELKENLKKYLAGLAKKSSTSSEPLQLTLKDLKEADKRGKWWLIGAAWDGDPLLELSDKQTATNDTSETLVQLARQQGMNTDVRRSIFTTLMSAEDYVDASEKLNSLSLTAVQQREIVRVLLHCLGHVCLRSSQSHKQELSCSILINRKPSTTHIILLLVKN